MGAHLARLHVFVNTSQIVAILDGLPLSEPGGCTGTCAVCTCVDVCVCACVNVCVCVYVCVCVCVYVDG